MTRRSDPGACARPRQAAASPAVHAATAVLLASLLLAATTAAADPDSAPAGPPIAQSAEDALVDLLLSRYDADHFDRCGASPTLQLNEVCSVGIECDPDVRVSDFVELYNPGRREVDLDCFVLANDDETPYVPDGVLAPGALRAWGERDLGFRLAKTRDRIRLYRMTAPTGSAALELIEALEVADFQALSYRSPDGGSWRHVSAAEAETEHGATFGAANP